MKPLKSPIDGAGASPATMASSATPAVLDVEHGHHRRGEAADRADREVDLAEQQDEHDADRDRPHGRDLQHQVGEVDRGEEAVVLELEDRPDQAIVEETGSEPSSPRGEAA